MPPPLPPPIRTPFHTLLLAFLLATGVKLLLVPGYCSTDFEVHRNWLALTYARPLKQWYAEATSEWTLDYPPFFAFFERGLASIAAFLLPHDPGILRVSATPYASEATVWFQRLSVMATDLLLLLGTWANIPSGYSHPKLLLLASATIGSAGLLLVDHMHFQYNGFLLGLLLLSVACIRRERPYLGAALFAALLMCKHLFLSLAPAYFLRLLRTQCHGPPPNQSFRTLPFLALGLIVLSVFSMALGPFLIHSTKEEAIAQLQQMLARLFPFGRGLVHAYWAPNVYAFYCLTDLALGALGRRLAVLPSRAPGKASWASGLVQVVKPEVLPSITPLMTALLTLGSMAPALWRLWTPAAKGGQDGAVKRQNSGASLFVACLFHCSLCAFMLGWHVHEKAVLVPALLIALLAPTSPRYAHLAFWLSTIGHAALLPLFPPRTADALAAYCLLQAHALLLLLLTQHAHPHHTALQWPWHERLYFVGLQLVLLFAFLIHPWLLAGRYPFLARLLCSVYCAVGLVAVWARSYHLLWVEKEGEEEGKTVVSVAAASEAKAGARATAAAPAAKAEGAKAAEKSSSSSSTPQDRKKRVNGKSVQKEAALSPTKKEVVEEEGTQRRSRRLRQGKEKQT